MTDIQVSTAWENFVVPSKYSYLTVGHVPAQGLAAIIARHDGSEGYYCAYDLEARADFKAYSGRKRPALGLVNFDLDSENLSESLAQAKALAAYFVELGCASEHLYIAFSGSKGFHIGLPECYLPLAHDESVNIKHHDIALSLKKKFPLLDTSVYNAARKFRLPGSRHADTGLYKTQFSYVRFKDISLPEVLEAAKVRTPVAALAYSGIRAKPLAELMSLVSGRDYEKSANDEQVFTKFESFKDKKCIKAMLEDRCAPGRKQNTALRIISDMYLSGKTKVDCLAALTKWKQANGVVDDKVEKTIDQVYDSGQPYSYGCNDEYKQEKCSGKCKIYAHLSPATRPDVVDAPRALEKKETLTEVEVCKKLVEGFGSSAVVDHGELFTYTGTHWQMLAESGKNALLGKILELFGNDATSRQVDSAYTTLLRMLPCPRFEGQMFSSSPYTVNFLNGTLHFSQEKSGAYSVVFGPHRREDFCVTLLPYNYEKDSEAANTSWEHFLRKCFQGDDDAEDKILSISEMFGAAIAPVYPRLFFLHGSAGSGKSTILKVLRRFLTENNVGSVDPSRLYGFNLQSLGGKLVNMVTDVQTTTYMCEDVLKKVIDGEKVLIERKFKENVRALLPAVHIFAGNAIPKTREENFGAQDRRWTFVQFKNAVPQSEQVVNFDAQIFNENPQGILAFALKGLKRVLEKRGVYTNSETAVAEIRSWQSANDSLDLFLEDLHNDDMPVTGIDVSVEAEGKIRRSRMYELYKAWTEECAPERDILGKKDFYIGMRRKGRKEIRVDGYDFFNGYSERGQKHVAKGQEFDKRGLPNF